MKANSKILSEVIQLKVMAVTMTERATRLEELLTGEGKLPVSTRKGRVNKAAATVLANRNKTIFKKPK